MSIKDYKKRAMIVGDFITSIETGWKGKIIDVDWCDHEPAGPMLKCAAWCFWSNSFDERELQWFAPDDVLKRDALNQLDFTNPII